VPGLFDDAVKPQRVAGSLDTHDGSRRKLRIKCRDIVMLVIEHALVHFSVGGIHPANGLGSHVQIHSDVHRHLRLLFQPMPTGSE